VPLVGRGCVTSATTVGEGSDQCHYATVSLHSVTMYAWSYTEWGHMYAPHGAEEVRWLLHVAAAVIKLIQRDFVEL
jgi:hypothetical protein